jgi:cytoskeleton protein RodZ
MPEIGATLREARMRARIDVSEIEAQTKIRAKYLRALENEEWSLLPGPTFVKSFLRTYATALNLDGKALVEEYRMTQERPSEGMFEPIVSPSQRNQGRGRSQPSGPSLVYSIAVGAIVLVIIVLIVLLVTSGGSGKKTPTTATTTTPTKTTHAATKAKHDTAPSQLLALSLKPTAPIYVCLIGDNGRKLIPGLELQAGESTSTYHAKHFEVALGNNSVTMYIDGRPRSVPASTAAIGYSITKSRGRRTLSKNQLPTCK